MSETLLKLTDRKLVTVETYGTLTELGGISGPILNPCFMDIKTIMVLVTNRRKVFECNPANTDDRIKLTTKNVRTQNFPPVNVVVKPHLAPGDKKEPAKKEETTTTKPSSNKKPTIEPDFIVKS